MTYRLALMGILFMAFSASAQPQWQRSEPSKTPDVEILPSTMLSSQPTTETLNKGDFEYEISHRFEPPVTSGYNQVWGLEGPVTMRSAVGYGVHDRVMVTLGFSTLLNNVDLQLKYKLWQVNHPKAQSAIAIRGGLAWNTEIPSNFTRGVFNDDNLQYYLQGVFNTRVLDNRLGIGVVPSYLFNSNIFVVKRQKTFTLGMYAQIFLNRMWSLWVDYNPTLGGYKGPIQLSEIGKFHHSLSTGFAIETGGHSFFVTLTNNARLNPSQYLAGADTKASSGDFRLGFGITRRL